MTEDAPSTLVFDPAAGRVGGPDGRHGRVLPVPPTALSGTVYERFLADVELLSVPVAEGSKPIGWCIATTSPRSWPQIRQRALCRKPVSELMDPQPLIVDHTVPVDELEWVIANKKSSALVRGFIVTDAGDYVGVCDALSLLRLGMARSTRRNRELRASKEAAEPPAVPNRNSSPP